MSKEAILQLLQDSKYEDALNIVRSEEDVTDDAILKEQWSIWQSAHAPITEDRAVPLLRRITDKPWVLAQCIKCTFDDPKVQKDVLDLGIALTEPEVDKIIKDTVMNVQDAAQVQKLLNDPTYEITAELSVNDISWIYSRLCLLQYSDRLKTFEDIWVTSSSDFATGGGDTSSQPSSADMSKSASLDSVDKSMAEDTESSEKRTFGQEFQSFRDTSLVAQAIQYARTENFEALDILFYRHGSEILPYRLQILSQVPETSDLTRCSIPRVALPKSNSEQLQEHIWEEAPWRKDADLVEHPKLRQYIKGLQKIQDLNANELEDTLESTPYPAPADIISQWYIERARRIDEFTGLTSNALKFIQYASMMHVPNLQELENNLEFLCKLLYGTGVTRETEAILSDLDLNKFEVMDPYEVLELSLEGTSVSRVVLDLKIFALPWLQLVDNRKSGMMDEEGDVQMQEQSEIEESGQAMLYRWILSVAESHLDWCCVTLESSKPTMQEEDRIIKEDLDLSRIALAILYTNDDGSQVDLMARIFECLPLFDLDNIESDTEENIDLHALSETLTAHGFFAALQQLKERELSTLMDGLQIHLSSAEILWRYELNVPLRWYLRSANNYDMQKQLCLRLATQIVSNAERKGVLGAMSQEEIFEIYWKALLRCGKFTLAKDSMLPKYGEAMISINKAQQLVVDAAREYFDNSVSGNMYSGNMKLAAECLKVVPPNPLIQQEMNLIEATHHLTTEFNVFYRPGIPIMPMQIRQSKNRLELISRLLASNPGAYRKSARIIDLAKKLGLQNDKTTEIRVLNMLSAAALAEEDYETSYRLCKNTLTQVLESEAEIHNSKLKAEMKEITWSSCFQLGKLDVYTDKTKRLELLAMALVLCPADRLSENLAAWRKLEAIAEREADKSSLPSSSSAGNWDTVTNLLQSGLQGQRNLAKLLSDEAGNLISNKEPNQAQADKMRKRDLLKNTVSKWLFD
ncbi:hypothetical protein K450DRAFT_219577 [Umbelopsis ramanniana AG]|uniref:Sec39 domain-containing protein n=1 Tax=Umbelopsis ramanniana AG TaxID=1314678 RepID=A0AAD5EJZ8_UMBRA|nr:uncharacterized protein K450DRAFT_219577 [Umbelopsis ramanniana AG]KAI8584381.1 hypothetical protein K450DRAFT_219577 [Umbelopsis ramanniana AG]